MCEMLGNQYFIAGNYLEAIRIYSNIINTEKTNAEIQKKLIISYLKTTQLNSALLQFIAILNSSRSVAKCNENSNDYCVCREMISELNENKWNNIVGLDRDLMLAMLWYFCDLKQSRKYFKRASILAPNDKHISKINKIILNN